MTVKHIVGRGNDWESLARSIYMAGYTGNERIIADVSEPKFFRQNREELEMFANHLLNEEGA